MRASLSGSSHRHGGAWLQQLHLCVSTNAVESTGGSAARQESECSSINFCNSEYHSWIDASGLDAVPACGCHDCCCTTAVRASCDCFRPEQASELLEQPLTYYLAFFGPASTFDSVFLLHGTPQGPHTRLRHLEPVLTVFFCSFFPNQKLLDDPPHRENNTATSCLMKPHLSSRCCRDPPPTHLTSHTKSIGKEMSSSSSCPPIGMKALASNKPRRSVRFEPLVIFISYNEIVQAVAVA